MNTTLLDTVRRTILRRPNQFCAAQWAFARNAHAVLQGNAQPVGFRCCIAGHALLQSGACTRRELLRQGGFHTGGPLWDRAAEALRIGEKKSHRLFFPSQWDKPFKQEYYLCSQDEEAAVAAAYLDYFVGEYGTDSVVDGRYADGAPAPSGSSSDRVVAGTLVAADE